MFLMAHNMTLDAFDIAILKQLQMNGALTNAELSERVHLSPSQCSRRKAALEAAGYIERYTAQLNPALLGFDLRAITRVVLHRHSDQNAEDFAKFITRHDAIRAAYSVSGDSDYVLEIHLQDLARFADFIHTQLLVQPMVAQVRSEIVLKTLKSEPGVPI